MLPFRAPPPWPDERVLWDADGLLVVDKVPGIAVHGDAAPLGSVVERLEAWLGSRGGRGALGVHHRLDKGASGVLAFSRTGEARELLGGAFEGHTIERRYQAIVCGPLPREGTLRDHLAQGGDGRTRTVERGGKLAVSHYRTLERIGPRALLELTTETGRTHQLRVQLASRGAPIVGDSLYGGETAPRLMLHATRLGLGESGPSLSAPAPEAFDDWLRSGELRLGSAERLARALSDALCRRMGLWADATAVRVADDAADDLPGLTVDRYEEYAVLGVRSEQAEARAADVARALEGLGARGVYLKVQQRADRRRVDAATAAPPEPIRGEPAPEPLEVRQGHFRYSVRLGDGHSTGLFLDQRDNRATVASLSAGKRLLNLFCYTGSFTVAAAVGGARASVNVDLSRRALARLTENLARNGIDVAQHSTVAEDVITWLRRARRRDLRFDIVVLDPPSFGTRGKRTFSVAKDYARFAADALCLVEPGGHLLAVTNHRGTSPERFRKILHDAARAAGREVGRMTNLPMPLDFPFRPDGRLPTKSVLVTVR